MRTAHARENGRVGSRCAVSRHSPLAAAAALVAALWLPSTVKAGDADPPSFELVFEAPEEIVDEAFSEHEIDVRGLIVTHGTMLEGVGIQAWSVGVTVDSGAIVAATTAGTLGASDADDPPGVRQAGFAITELTEDGVDDCEGSHGAVSTVVLGFGVPVVLPPDESPHLILNLTVRVWMPADPRRPSLTRLSWVDGCRGSEQPVRNLLTVGGETVVPALSEALITRRAESPCVERGLALVFQDEPRGQIDALTSDEESLTERVVTRRPGAEAATWVWGAISSDLDTDGVQGWSLSIALEGDAVLSKATTTGTVGASYEDDVPGLRRSGFERTEVVDPERDDGTGCGQGEGAVSAVVLSFIEPVTLAPTGTATVLGLEVSVPDGSEGASLEGVLRWQDGLAGAG